MYTRADCLGMSALLLRTPTLSKPCQRQVPVHVQVLDIVFPSRGAMRAGTLSSTFSPCLCPFGTVGLKRQGWGCDRSQIGLPVGVRRIVKAITIGDAEA
jgi:hypothetical protein